MAGMPGRSGGHNRVSIEEHIRRGTFRPARHGGRVDPPEIPVSEADRRRTLAGLSPEARRTASELLAAYSGWDAAGLATLRSYVLSLERLRRLEADPGDDAAALHREMRTTLNLLKALNLEAVR